MKYQRARYWYLNSLSWNGRSTKSKRSMFNKYRTRHARPVHKYNKFGKSQQKESDVIREAADIYLAEQLARAATKRRDTRANERSLCLSRFEKMHTDLYMRQSIYCHLIKNRTLLI